MKIETLTINNVNWEQWENMRGVYYCAEKDRFAYIVEGEIETVGYLDNVLEAVN